MATKKKQGYYVMRGRKRPNGYLARDSSSYLFSVLKNADLNADLDSKNGSELSVCTKYSSGTNFCF